jgi:hypothetical protein
VVVKEQLVNVRHPCLKAVRADQAADIRDRHYNLPAQVVGLVMQVVLDAEEMATEQEVVEQQPPAKVLIAKTADPEQLLLLLALQLLVP